MWWEAKDYLPWLGINYVDHEPHSSPFQAPFYELIPYPVPLKLLMFCPL